MMTPGETKEAIKALEEGRDLDAQILMLTAAKRELASRRHEEKEKPETLPPKIAITANGAYIKVKDDRLAAPFLAIVQPGGAWDACFGSPELCRLTMTEAVRRYNAWEEINQIFRECNGYLNPHEIRRVSDILRPWADLSR